MEPAGLKYVAIRTIMGAGDTPAIAYAEGDLVHESLVVGDANAGPGAWLTLGVDVEPRVHVRIDRPADNASHGAWVAYAVGEGADRDKAEAMSRATLVREYGS